MALYPSPRMNVCEGYRVKVSIGQFQKQISFLFKMYYVYVPFSLKDKKFYIGFSADVKKRVKEHSQGKNISIKPRRPFELVYYEAHYSKADAQKRERYFKTTKGKAALKQMPRQSITEFSLSEGKNTSSLQASPENTYGQEGLSAPGEM